MPPHHSPPMDPAAHLAPRARALSEATRPRGTVAAAQAQLAITATEKLRASG